RWIAQLERGPTWASRAQAARALALDHTPTATAALSRLARDGRAAASLRVEAVKALKGRRDAATLVEVASSPVIPPDVGVAVCVAAAELAKDENLDQRDRDRLREVLAS